MLVLRKAVDAVVIQVGLVCSIEGGEGQVEPHCVWGRLMVLRKAVDAAVIQVSLR